MFPTPWRTLAALAIVLLLVAAPASAQTETLTVEDSLSSVVIAGSDIVQNGAFAPADGPILPDLYFPAIENFPGFEVALIQLPYSSAYNQFTYDLPEDLLEHPSGSTSCVFLDGAEEIGTGTINFNVNFVNDVPTTIVGWIDVESWDIGDRYGPKWISVSYNRSEIYGFCLGYTIPRATNTQISTPAEWCDDHTVYIGHRYETGYFAPVYANQIGRSSYYWTNVVDIDENPSVTRVVGGVVYPSYVRVYDDVFTYYEGTANDDISVSTVTGPYSLQIVDPSGTVNETYTYGGIPIDNATATVYVRSSQTGALISGANITIDDTTTDPWTEVVNTTLPSGTGAFSLPIDTGLHLTQYKVTATADGYTQTVPALFFRLTGNTNVLVEMDPTTGAPVNETNTYLQFYVRDTAGNGIGSANVLVGDSLKYTNAQGYTQFEVPINATYSYTVSKLRYTSVSGTATVLDGDSYTVTVTLTAGTVPTYTPVPTDPGATPTPDTRTNEEKGQAVIDMVADNAEGIGALGLICLIMGLLKLLAKW